MTACRVGIADDAPDVRMLLRTILEEEGFTVVGEARNGAEAVDLAREEQPDVLLLDLSMPVMDGLEALPLVLDASSNTAVIVLSGFVNADVSQKVIALGAAACVEKGINLAGLVQTVREHCPSANGAAGSAARSGATATAAGTAAPAGGGSSGAGGSANGGGVGGGATPAADPGGRAGGSNGGSARRSTGRGADDASRVLDADDLVPVLLHELNPAVSILRRSLDVAASAVEQGSATDAQPHLDTARRALGAVTAILDAFTQVRAAEAGQLHLRPRPVDLPVVVRETVKDLETLTEGNPVDVVVESNVKVTVDADRLRQVLANLLSNAAKFSPANTRIEVGVGTLNGDALVWVRDAGKGVPPEAAEAIFRKYARLGEAPGMGLGLYIARALVRAHGGELTVETPPDGGARFVARLPLS